MAISLRQGNAQGGSILCKLLLLLPSPPNLAKYLPEPPRQGRYFARLGQRGGWGERAPNTQKHIISLFFIFGSSLAIFETRGAKPPTTEHQCVCPAKLCSASAKRKQKRAIVLHWACNHVKLVAGKLVAGRWLTWERRLTAEQGQTWILTWILIQDASAGVCV